MPDDNGKQNPEESYTNKYQKHIACSYGYKLVFVDEKFRKSFNTYLGKDAVYNFTILLIVKLKKVNVAVKSWKNIGKVPTMSKKTMSILRTLLNVRIVTMIMLIMLLSEIIVILLEKIEVLGLETVI